LCARGASASGGKALASPAKGGSAYGGKAWGMYYLYIVKSEKFGKLYTGITDDLGKRLAKYNSGSVRSTKAFRPYRIIYNEEYSSKTEARKRELFLKSGQGRKWIKENIVT